MPERELREAPFEEAAVDLIGPWKMTVNTNRGIKEVEFNALTCIDPVSNLVELIRVDRKTAAHVGSRFEQSWLCRYPWPRRCVHDRGGEFRGEAFQQLLQNAGIKSVPTTSKNPQANAICERMHQTVANVLRTLCNTNPPRNMNRARSIVDSALSYCDACYANECHYYFRQ